jgi:hypothetical protein
MPELIVHISPQGQITLQTHGFRGTTCQEATRALEKSLGLKTSELPTSEMFQQQTMPQTLHQQ